MDEDERERALSQIDRSAIRIAVLAKQVLPEGSHAMVIVRGPSGDVTLASTGRREEGIALLQYALAEIIAGDAYEEGGVQWKQ